MVELGAEPDVDLIFGEHALGECRIAGIDELVLATLQDDRLGCDFGPMRQHRFELMAKALELLIGAIEAFGDHPADQLHATETLVPLGPFERGVDGGSDHEDAIDLIGKIHRHASDDRAAERVADKDGFLLRLVELQERAEGGGLSLEVGYEGN